MASGSVDLGASFSSGAGGGSGTVTSVAMTVPNILSVAGSPITTSGTLAVSLAAQNANLVFAGPTSGMADTPAFRSLVLADIPSLPYASSTLTNAHIFVGNGSNVATDVPVSGDLTLANTGAFTLNTVNSNVGSFGSSTSIPSFTVNAKGLITAASGNVVIAPAGTLTGATLAANVLASSLTSVGTIATGVWNGTAVDVAHGGTGIASGTSGGIPYFSGASTIASSAALTANQLIVGGGAGATPASLGSLGTTTTVLHGNAAGNPSFGAVSLTADVSGVLPIANGGTNNGSLAVTAGGVPYTDGSKLVNVGAGTSGQLLQSAAASAPTWVTPYLLPRTTQTGTTYTLLASDKMSVVEFTGSAATTFSITAAATLGAGWWCYVKNSGSGAANAGQITFDPNASETIDALTTMVTYPGDLRLITCDGSNFFTQLIEGGYVQYTATGASTWTVPSKVTRVHVELWGGGGQGGGGRRGAGSSARAGGSGGGGGAYVYGDFTATNVGSSVTVTIAALANAAGAGGSTDPGSGQNGSDGNNSTFGALLTAFGGGGGSAGGTGASSGGGGGGCLTAGSGAVGGGPLAATGGNSGFGGGTGTSNVAGAAAGHGGAAGGGSNVGTPGINDGGSSYRGGAGGGAGGYITAANASVAGKLGGGGPGALSANSASTAGNAGTSGVAGTGGGTATAGPSALGPGDAGSGGGAGFDNTGGGTASAAGNGAAGGIACGGGGGGASMNGQTAGNGGAGGSGLCRISYS